MKAETAKIIFIVVYVFARADFRSFCRIAVANGKECVEFCRLEIEIVKKYKLTFLEMPKKRGTERNLKVSFCFHTWYIGYARR